MENYFIFYIQHMHEAFRWVLVWLYLNSRSTGQSPWKSSLTSVILLLCLNLRSTGQSPWKSSKSIDFGHSVRSRGVSPKCNYLCIQHLPTHPLCGLRVQCPISFVLDDFRMGWFSAMLIRMADLSECFENNNLISHILI